MTRAAKPGNDDTRTQGAPDAPSATPPVAFPSVDPAHFAVRHEHARGGLGRILAAHDRVLERPVAIKELLTSGPDAAARFVREAMLTARLQHPAIVPVYEAGRWPNGEPFYAMKMVAGRSLKEAIAAAPTLDARLALLPHVITVAEAMAYAHSERVIHRDLKPANVVLGEFGETVIVDWGIAKRLDDGEARAPGASAEPVTPEATASGAVVGTPQYMPPEQALGAATDERTDVYALGAILYHVLAGRPPYDGSWSDALAQTIAGPPRSLREVEPATPPDLADIVARAMARDPAGRYPGARSLADDLRRFQTGQLVSSHHYSTAHLVRRWIARHRLPVALTIGFAALLAAVTGIAFARVTHARAAAEERRNHVVLLQAQAALERAPASALAWLKTYPIATGDFRAVRAIFAAARGRGAVAIVPNVLFGNVTALPAGRGFRFVLDDGRVVDLDPASGAQRVQHLGALPPQPVCADVSKRGDLVVVADRHELVLFDVAGHERREIPLPAGQAIAHDWCGFSDDQRWVAFGSTGGLGLLRLDGGAVRIVPGADAAGGFAAAPDGALAVWTAWPEHALHVVELATGASHDWATAGLTPWYVVGFSNDGRHVFTTTDEGHLLVWARDGTLEQNVAICAGTLRRAQAVGPDGIAARCDDGSALVVPAGGGAPRTLPGRAGAGQGWIDAGEPAGERIISLGVESATVWNLATGEQAELRFDDEVFSGRATSDGAFFAGMTPISRKALILRMPRFGDRRLPPSAGAHFSPDGGRLVLLSPDGLSLCDAQGEACRLLAVDHPTWADFSADGSRLAYASGVQSGWFEVARGTRHDVGTGIRGAAWSPAANRLALGEDRQTLRLLDVDSDGDSGGDSGGGSGGDSGGDRLVESGQYAYALSWSRDGRRLAWRDDVRNVEVLEVESGERVHFAADTWIPALAFAPDGRRLFGGGLDGKLWIWDITTGTAAAIAPWHELQVTVIAVSPDGRTVATGSEDRSVRLLDVDTQRSTVLAGHTGEVTGLEFSRDGRRLASASADGTVRVWDVASGDVQVLRGAGQPMRSVAFSPDGAHLVGASAGGTMLWDLTRLPPVLADAAAVSAAIDAETTVVLGADDRATTLIAR